MMEAEGNSKREQGRKYWLTKTNSGLQNQQAQGYTSNKGQQAKVSRHCSLGGRGGGVRQGVSIIVHIFK